MNSGNSDGSGSSRTRPAGPARSAEAETDGRSFRFGHKRDRDQGEQEAGGDVHHEQRGHGAGLPTPGAVRSRSVVEEQRDRALGKQGARARAEEELAEDRLAVPSHDD